MNTQGYTSKICDDAMHDEHFCAYELAEFLEKMFKCLCIHVSQATDVQQLEQRAKNAEKTLSFYRRQCSKVQVSKIKASI